MIANYHTEVLVHCMKLMGLEIVVHLYSDVPAFSASWERIGMKCLTRYFGEFSSRSPCDQNCWEQDSTLIFHRDSVIFQFLIFGLDWAEICYQSSDCSQHYPWRRTRGHLFGFFQCRRTLLLRISNFIGAYLIVIYWFLGQSNKSQKFPGSKCVQRISWQLHSREVRLIDDSWDNVIYFS